MGDLMHKQHLNLVKKMSILSKILLVYLYARCLKQKCVSFNKHSFLRFLYGIGIKNINFIQIEESYEECCILFKEFA